MASADLSMAFVSAIDAENMPWKVQVSSASTSASDLGSDGLQEFGRDVSSPSGESEGAQTVATNSPKLSSAMAAGMLSTTPGITPPPGLEVTQNDTPSKVQPTSAQEGLLDIVQDLQQQVNVLQYELYAQHTQMLNPSTRPGIEDVWADMAATYGPGSGTPFPYWGASSPSCVYNHIGTEQEFMGAAVQRHLKKGPSAMNQRVRKFCTSCGERLQQPSALFCTNCGHRLD